ncbi:hypothetical protein LI171_04935 [Emergencia timonensis]|uniref:hypothetical protein n=1 Tax=Emergencia timonensis TaxID=1776384 RepID=UPI001D08A594|nr:hypothetical protein [Emergencia timonensis]MCB6475583.1 hypothetical protein [Emergencia timonensis]
MNIDCGRYIIKSDPLNLWVEEKYKTKKGDEATKVVTGYAPTFELLLQNFVKRRLRSSDAETVKGFLSDLAQAERDLLDLTQKAGTKLDERTVRADD